MRFLTCADSEADTAVGWEGDDDGEEDDEELNGLRPPKDIFSSANCGLTIDFLYTDLGL